MKMLHTGLFDSNLSAIDPLHPKNLRAPERQSEDREQEQIEQPWIEEEKTHSVDQLAGSMAHEFNNLLQIILEYSDMLMKDLHPSDSHYHYVTEILLATQRAASLTDQLLTLSQNKSESLPTTRPPHVLPTTF